jgi:hypothetical protein
MMRRILLVLTALAGFSVPAHAQTVYVGQIIEVGANFCPVGFFATDGQILPISPYITLFSLIGNAYGGDGKTTFAVPHLVPPLTVTRQPTTLCIAYVGVYPPRS